MFQSKTKPVLFFAYEALSQEKDIRIIMGTGKFGHEVVKTKSRSDALKTICSNTHANAASTNEDKYNF